MTPLSLTTKDISDIQSYFTSRNQQLKKVKILSAIAPLIILLQPFVMLNDTFSFQSKLTFGLVPYLFSFYALSKAFSFEVRKSDKLILQNIPEVNKISKSGNEFEYISDYKAKNKHEDFINKHGRKPLRIEVRLNRAKQPRKNNK